MSDLNIPVLERPAFFDGQRLTAEDLTSVQMFQAEMRWLHNRSLHNWGIALGFAVSGARGDKAVTVQPGYALDCLGKELISTQTLTLPIPPVAGDGAGNPRTYYLTASYAEDASLTPQQQTGTCGTSGAVRRQEAPIVRWQDPNDSNSSSQYQRGLDIVLASIQVQNCQLVQNVSATVRRDAIPEQQPYVFASQTVAGSTVWTLWTPPNGSTAVGVVTTVSTATAGFNAPPAYQANVVGGRFVTGAQAEQIVNNPEYANGFVVDGYAQIANATSTSFDLIVTLPTGATVGATSTDIVTSADIHNVILGIEKDLVDNHGVASGDVHLFNTPLGFITSFEAGQTFSVMVGAGEEVPITPLSSDFDTALNAIATRNNMTVAELLSYNNMSLTALPPQTDTVKLSLNQVLVTVGNSMPVNPSGVVFTPSFLNLLNNTLHWTVIWSGVEGG